MRLLALLIIAVCLPGQAPPDSKEQPAVRFESVHFNFEDCIFTVTVSEGTTVDGKHFQPTKVHDYQMDLHEATMAKDGQDKRTFAPEEAALFHRIMRAIVADYATESVIWFEQGGGDPAKDKKPAKAADSARRKYLRSMVGGERASGRIR